MFNSFQWNQKSKLYLHNHFHWILWISQSPRLLYTVLHLDSKGTDIYNKALKLWSNMWHLVHKAAPDHRCLRDLCMLDQQIPCHNSTWSHQGRLESKNLHSHRDSLHRATWYTWNIETGLRNALPQLFENLKKNKKQQCVMNSIQLKSSFWSFKP